MRISRFESSPKIVRILYKKNVSLPFYLYKVKIKVVSSYIHTFLYLKIQELARISDFPLPHDYKYEIGKDSRLQKFPLTNNLKKMVVIKVLDIWPLRDRAVCFPVIKVCMIRVPALLSCLLHRIKQYIINTLPSQ